MFSFKHIDTILNDRMVHCVFKGLQAIISN